MTTNTATAAAWLREGIRYLLGTRNASLPTDMTQLTTQKMQFIADLKSQKSIAVHTDKANEQHYEVPTEFIKQCLGQRLKYSCCLFPTGNETLDEAEEFMLRSYCDKARLEDGMAMLDLGCGWGSLSLYLAEKFPNSTITALSNSKTQKAYIDGVAKQRHFTNLTVLTHDVQFFDTQQRFDRVLSIEMLEHMKNYPKLFERIASWLKPQGLFFAHVFSHRSMPYHFETDEANSWMARYFFTGGTMPSDDLFLHFQDHLTLVDRWSVNGTHYAKTSRKWLENMDKDEANCLKTLKDGGRLSDEEAYAWLNRWRTFYMAVEELFAYQNGNTWLVSHYLFKKK